MAEYTNHGKKRMKQRAGKSSRMFELALERGHRRSEYSGGFGRYLDGLGIKYKSIQVVYGNDIYCIGKQNQLITVLKIPSKFLGVKAK